MIMHTSRQWQVGHGGFCTAEISSERNGLSPIRYVYDCGAMRPRQLYEGISRYLSEVAAQSGVIELVILSHVDWDHVNGMRRLLSDPSVRVKRVMLPLLSPAERLLAVARSSSAMAGSDGVNPVDPGDGGSREGPDGFELDLMLDPVATIRGLDPDIELILVEDSEGDDGPTVAATPSPIEDFQALLRLPVGLGDVGMIGVGTGRTKHDPHSGDNYMSDRNGVRIHETSRWSAWLLAPYVSPRIRDRVAEFMEAVAARLAIPEDQLYGQLLNPESARRLVVENRKTLRDVYERFGGANPSSMCLYSGPLPTAQHAQTTTMDSSGRVVLSSEIAGTLFTGDAMLKKVEAVDALTDHFGALISLVSTLHLPHHGSWGNASSDLLDALPNLQFVLAMTPVNSRGHHPGQETIDAVNGRGLEPHLVTTAPESAVVMYAKAF